VNPSPPSDAERLPPGYPARFERSWRAGDGTRVQLRPLRPSDLERELRFLEGLSELTLYQRVQYVAREITHEEVARMLDLDYRDRMAIGALVGAPPEDELIGISRYARIDETDTAECAIVVTDAWHGRGLGTELMRSLGLAARANGLRTLQGTTLAGNTRISDWARRLGYEMRTEPNSGGAMRITLDLSSLPS
jgi:acetyltransferase